MSAAGLKADALRGIGLPWVALCGNWHGWPAVGHKPGSSAAENTGQHEQELGQLF
jgi:hypothetical protein